MTTSPGSSGRKVSIQLEVFKEDQTPENGTEVYSKAEAEIAEPKPILRKRPKQKRPVPAVRIRNASKSYGSGKPVLDKLEMNVPRGTIYGLLGSSGCGKTTILSCTVGLAELNSGEILVFGSRPGTKGSGIPGRRLGYMPQDIALYENLTIQEILQYFGRIFGMAPYEIEEQTEFLVNFLHLPNRQKAINTLSGGQQRRTSLAACLIHDPELLILDEPTVGLDPLLRESIWNHLYDLVSHQKTTVIITTHYIEEARHAHTVGLLRNGRLLAEKAPQDLITEHKANLLEDIVLKLCRDDLETLDDDESKPCGRMGNIVREALREISFYSKPSKLLPLNQRHQTAEVISEPGQEVVGVKFKRMTTAIGDKEVRFSVRKPRRPSTILRKNSFIDTLTDDTWFRIMRIQALTVRNYLNFIRNPIFVLGIILIPTIQMLLTTLIVGSDPDFMRLGVVNHETPNWKDDCASLNYSVDNPCGLNLSCKFLDQLKYHTKDSFELVSVKSEVNAVEQVKRGQLWGFMSIPEDYSEHVKLRKSYGLYPDDESLNGSVITLRLDNSHYLASLFIRNNLYVAYQDYLQNSLKECNNPPREAELPLDYSSPVYGGANSHYMEFILPGALIMILYLITMCSCAVSIITDRQQGTLDRSRVAGIQTFDIMVSYFITEGTTVLVQVGLGSVVLICGFNLQVHGSVPLFLFICFLTGLCGQATGLLLGILCQDQIGALFIGIFFYLPMMLLAGVIWPLEGMHVGVRYFSYCLPLTLTCESLRSVTNRGVGILHPRVYPGVLIVIAWTFAFWLVALMIFRSFKKK